MILLDTNVVSELMRPRPEPKVAAWIAKHPATEFYLSAVTEAELRYGVEVLPAGNKRQLLQVALTEILEQDFAGRILPFNSAAAIAYAVIAADRRRTARPVSQMDAQILQRLHVR